jgi:hypothetical protein
VTISREELFADLGVSSDEIMPEEEEGSEDASSASSASPPDVSDVDAATDEPDIRERIAELIGFAAACAMAGKRMPMPQLDRVYIAGTDKLAFIFDTVSIVLDSRTELLPDLVPAAEAVLAYLEGSST